MMSLDEVRTRGTISVREGAEILGISESQYYRTAKAGHLPSIKVGRRVIIPVPQLLRLLDGKASTVEVA